MKMTSILSVCVFLCAVTTTLAATWDLSAVKITLPARPNRVQRLAAQELVYHLTRITGAAPSGAACECVFAPPPGAAPVQNFEAFCRIEGTKAWFWGDDDSQPKVGGGTLFAVYAFLNKRLGVDWVYPGDDGVVFRRRKTVEMPDSWNDRYCPPLTQTGIRNYFGTPKVIEKEDQVPPAMRLSEVEAKKRLADVARWYQRRRLQSRERIPYGHAFLNWQDRFLKTHPEYAKHFEAMPFNSGYFMCVKPIGVEAEKVRRHLIDKYSVGTIVLSGLIRLAFSTVPTARLGKLFASVDAAIADLVGETTKTKTSKRRKAK